MRIEDAEYIKNKLNEADELAASAHRYATSAHDALGDRLVLGATERAEAYVAQSNAIMAKAMVAHGLASLISMMEATKYNKSGARMPWIEALGLNKPKENA